MFLCSILSFFFHFPLNSLHADSLESQNKKKHLETEQSDTTSREKKKEKDIDNVNKKDTVQLTFLSSCFHNPKHDFHKH